MWLRRYQSQAGLIPSNVPYSIQYLMQNMITMSDNAATTSLFYFGGGCTDPHHLQHVHPDSRHHGGL